MSKGYLSLIHSFIPHTFTYWKQCGKIWKNRIFHIYQIYRFNVWGCRVPFYHFWKTTRMTHLPCNLKLVIPTYISYYNFRVYKSRSCLMCCLKPEFSCWFGVLMFISLDLLIFAFLRHKVSYDLFQWVSTGNDSTTPQDTWLCVEAFFIITMGTECHHLLMGGGRDAAKSPTTHKAAPPAKNCPAPNVNGAETETLTCTETCFIFFNFSFYGALLHPRFVKIISIFNACHFILAKWSMLYFLMK